MAMNDNIRRLRGERPHWYRLVGHEAVPIPGTLEQQMQAYVDEMKKRTDEHDPHRVAFTDAGSWSVSTIFLASDHNYSRVGPPLLFETMVFGGGMLDLEMVRTTTWDQAVAAHEAMVALCRGTGTNGA
jgi:hypothetical protein